MNVKRYDDLFIKDMIIDKHLVSKEQKMVSNRKRKKEKKKDKVKRRNKRNQNRNNNNRKKELIEKNSTTACYKSEINSSCPDNNCQSRKDANKTTFKSLMKRFFPCIYYLSILVSIFIIHILFVPLIMKCVASREVYKIQETAFQIVQDDRAIEKWIAPFSFAVSIFCSALILITFLYIVNYLLCKKGFFAPGLNIACIFLSCGVALFAVYTLGYDVSKEIYETNPEYFSEVFDVASGKKNSEKTSIAVENELTSRDETSEDEMTDQDASDNSPDSSEIGEYETYNYVTEVNGHRKDWALRASEFNKRANLMFTYAAALLIPLNWYKDEARKSDKNIDKNI